MGYYALGGWFSSSKLLYVNYLIPEGIKGRKI